MSALKDLTGMKFGRLTVIKRHYCNNKQNKPMWDCICDCGNPDIIVANGNDLHNGQKKSCGCLCHNRPKKEKPKAKPIVEQMRDKYIGQEKYNNEGSLMRIVEYYTNTNLVVEFQDEFKYRKTINIANYEKGTVRNPYNKFLHGKGYLGIGDYSASIGRVPTQAYEAWRKMMDRCYSNYKDIEMTYIGCQVAEVWHNFQNFAAWYYAQPACKFDGLVHVDKDWIHLGNKTYSPENCELVPAIINTCLLSHDKTKNKMLPRNIAFTASRKYKPTLCRYGKKRDLGTYEDLSCAMHIYMDNKIEYIHELANKYRDYITDRLYQTMMNYEQRFLKENPEYVHCYDFDYDKVSEIYEYCVQLQLDHEEYVWDLQRGEDE